MILDELAAHARERVAADKAKISLSSVDLPTFGKPTRPTSASSFSSRIMSRSTPGRPGLAKHLTFPSAFILHFPLSILNFPLT